MASEAVVVETPTVIRDFTVADGATIEQFTLCQLTDLRTATASSAADIFAGIAMTEKEASDGQVNLGLAQDGIFELTAAPGATTIPAGTMCKLSGANLIITAEAADLLTGKVVGKCLEEIAPSTSGEVDIGVRG